MTPTCQGCGTQFAQRPTGPCVSCGFSAPAAPAEHAKCFAADGRTQVYNIPGYPLMVRAVDFNAALAQTEQAAPRMGAAPEGWRLVPIEPTPEMRAAIIRQMDLQETKWSYNAEAVYRDALAAAPKETP